MSYKYFTVLTDVGKQKLAEAIANETALDFTEMAVGDSNGISYDPTSDMTALKHVTYRAAIGSMKINAEDKNIMEFEFVVPASTGGFYVREAGLYSSDGTLIAISRLPEQYKADMAEGAGSSMTVRILVAISSDAQIYITVPASITYATQTYVVEEFKKHKAEENPHTQYVLNETYSDKIDELQEGIDSKAANNHNHDGVYSKTNHTHTGYAASNHNHDSTYLKKTDASSTYATKKEMKTGLAGKADFIYAQTGVSNDLNNIKSTCISKFNGNALNGPNGGTWGHAFTFYHRDNNKYQFFVTWGGAICMRVNQGSSSGSTSYEKWVKILNEDGSIPKENVPATIMKYSNGDGVWKETPLDSGEIMLEGYGETTTGSEYGNIVINLPKTMKSNNYFVSGVLVIGEMLHAGFNLSLNTKVSVFELNFVDVNGFVKNKKARWYVKGILA